MIKHLLLNRRPKATFLWEKSLHHGKYIVGIYGCIKRIDKLLNRVLFSSSVSLIPKKSRPRRNSFKYKILFDEILAIIPPKILSTFSTLITPVIIFRNKIRMFYGIRFNLDETFMLIRNKVLFHFIRF